MRTVGVERERFMVEPSTGQIVSGIGELLPVVWQLADQKGLDKGRFTYELYAGQVEDKTPACASLEEVEEELERNESVLRAAAWMVGVAYDHAEFVEASQIESLMVNPFNQRHQSIWESLDDQTRLAASAVAAVHVHVGVEPSVAVATLNYCREDILGWLIALGDHSDGRRIESYRAMAGSNGVPPWFGCYAEVEQYITDKGGEKNVWDLVRYKPSTQTVEFRMFGASPCQSEIITYVQACLDIVG